MSDTSLDAVQTDVSIETPVETPIVKERNDLRQNIRDAVKTVRAKEEERAKQRDPLTKPEKIEPKDGRDTQGRFAKKEGAEPQAPSPQQTLKPQEGATTGAETKPLAAPGTWKPEARATWDQVPDHAKAEILRRESELTREVTKHQTELKQVRADYEDIDAAVGNRRGFLKAQYGSVGRAINEMFRLSDWAGQDPEGFSKWLFQQSGRQPQGNQGTQNPLEARLNGFESTLQGFVQSQQQQQASAIERQIDAFATAKDANGNLLRPHFEAVREDIFPLIQPLRVKYPQDTVEQTMDRAYRAAINVNDSVYPLVSRESEERARAALESKDRVNKAVVAQKFVSGTAPIGKSGGEVDDPNDLKATLRRNYRKVMNGQESRI